MLRWLAPLLLATFLGAQECTFVVSPASLSLPASGAAQLAPTLTVNASRGGCAWTARSNVSWITISFGQVGANNGTVGIRVDPNLEAVTRTGSLTVAGQTVTVLQAAANCTFTLNPPSRIAAAAGDTGSFQVTTTCNWQAISGVDWIDVTSPPAGRGAGNGTVSYSVRANTGATRSGAIQVGPLRFAIQQPAGVCIQTLSLTQVNLPAAGGNGTVQVTSPCSWTAASGVTWITLTGGASADRDGTLSYSVQPNTAAQARSGTIRIGNQTFTVNQASVGCAVALTPANVTIPGTGGSGTIAVASTCDWTAASEETWITISQSAGVVSYVVAANTGGNPRTGRITIGNQVFTVTQPAGACSVTISPASAQVGVAGGGGNFLVSAQPGCRWVALAQDDWISVELMAGEGTRTIIYTVAANPGPPRSSSIKVGSQSFQISQTGVLPSFTAAGVVSAASFADGPLAPGLIITIFGSGLGPATLVEAAVESAARRFPTELAGIRVFFDGVAAPLIYVSSGQLSAITPSAVAGRQITRIEVDSQGIRSQAVFMPVDAVAPAIFTESASGKGGGAILNQDSSANGPDHPALPGSVVSIYATGGGVMEPSTEDGRLVSGISRTLASVTAEVNGEPAEVLYAGGAPDLVAGMLQVNLRLPATLPPGNLPLVIRAGDRSSQQGVTISVR